MALMAATHTSYPLQTFTSPPSDAHFPPHIHIPSHIPHTSTHLTVQVELRKTNVLRDRLEELCRHFSPHLIHTCSLPHFTVQVELRKTNVLRDRLEELCRQLQRENREALEESKRRQEEDIRQRQAVQIKFSAAIDVREGGLREG